MSDNKKILQPIRKYPWGDEIVEITLFDTYVQALIVSGYKTSIPKLMELAENFVKFRDLHVKKKNMN